MTPPRAASLPRQFHPPAASLPPLAPPSTPSRARRPRSGLRRLRHRRIPAPAHLPARRRPRPPRLQRRRRRPLPWRHPASPCYKDSQSLRSLK
ncbi:hypothetical protein BRADI_4g17203v3 [Brachypodium distachyon]|uniref:Uncharacterized protein n=1 Tax=Brachypodium distachyon TaxID=15368 RepID=A0A0Q3H4H8_BRADI|nr:hypothetical protein BRADI_4g17203v3 [Brachypodium distachyon]